MNTIHRFSTTPEAIAFMHGVCLLDDPLITVAIGPAPSDITVTDHGTDEDCTNEDLVDYRADILKPLRTLSAYRPCVHFRPAVTTSHGFFKPGVPCQVDITSITSRVCYTNDGCPFTVYEFALHFIDATGTVLPSPDRTNCQETRDFTFTDL